MENENDYIDPYVIINDENIAFGGNTPREKELSQWLYHTTLELNRYQDMTQEVLEYIMAHLDEDNKMQDIYDIIQKFTC